MALKRKSSDRALEDKALEIRKVDNKGTLFNREHFIIWKISQNSHDSVKSFFDSFHSKIEVESAHDINFSCYLRNDLESQDYYRILLKLDSDTWLDHINSYNLRKNMHILLSLVDKNKIIRNTHKQVIKTISEEHIVIEFKKFIKKADLFDENNSFFSNEELIIYCKIYYGEERNVTAQILLDDDVPAYCERKVLDNFESLLESGKFSDMKFIIDNKELKVHKNILSLRNPVFKAMIEHNAQEQRNNSIEIIDISYETMKEVLRFVYSGKVNNVNMMAKDIFVAAEKYEISALKKICENKLIESRSVENICDMLKLINRYDSENLKKHVFNFISEHRKYLASNAKNFHETLNTLPVNLLIEIIELLMTRDDDDWYSTKYDSDV